MALRAIMGREIRELRAPRATYFEFLISNFEFPHYTHTSPNIRRTNSQASKP